MQLSMADIARYAYQAGFRGDALRNIVAIAWAESGGRTDAHGDTSLGRGSWGLFQIYLEAHPDISQGCATDPACAAAAAFRISDQGHNFNPWCTFPGGCGGAGSGTAGQYMNQAEDAIRSLGGDFLSGLGDIASGLGGAARGGVSQLPHPSLPSLPNPFSGLEGALTRFAYLVVAVFLIWLGLVLMVIPSLAKRADEQVTKVLPAVAAATPEGAAAGALAGAR